MVEIATILFSCLGFFLFFIGSDALLAALILASVFQAMAFANLSGSPLIIYYFFGLLFILRNLLDILWKPSLVQWSAENKVPLIWMWVFVMISLLGALSLPQVFEGAMVYSPKLSIDEQYNNLTRLVFGSSHFNQAAQLMINAVIFSLLWLRGIQFSLAIRWIFIAFWISIFFAGWQLVANVTGAYFPEEWLYTVDAWSVGNEQMAGGFKRINGAFLEPSTLSTYLIGVFAFLLVRWVKEASWFLFLCVLVAAIGLIITTSTTAYLGLLLVILAVLFGFTGLQILEGGWINKSLFGILTATILGLIFLSISMLASGEVRDLFDLVLTQKSEGDSFQVRLDADLQSLSILLNTYGLGLGLGSNRPSSFLAFLISNIGLSGLMAFIMLLMTLSKRAIEQGKASSGFIGSHALALVWGVWATVVAKIFAQPDLTFAPLWVWLFLLAIFCSHFQNQECLLGRS